MGRDSQLEAIRGEIYERPGLLYKNERIASKRR